MSGSGVNVICCQALGETGIHGKNILLKIPFSSDTKIRIGTYDDSELKTRIDSGGLPLDLCAESYAFGKTDLGYTLIGFDERGLMYGCQELSERLSGGETGETMENIRFSGKPFTKTRGIYSFLHNKDLEEEWFYSPEYWIRFFDEMAMNRYNSFNLVFSHQTSYLVPMFAYFLELPEFPAILPADADRKQIRRNRGMLEFISGQSEKRGIDFIIGIWQVSPWKNNPERTQKGSVPALTRENIKEYTYFSMKRLIKDFPAIKGLQIRANWESGIAPAEQTDFFTDTLFRAMAEAERPFIFDFRCWLAEPETVANALKMIPGTRLSCKYWAEFLGAPYQPAKIIPGYSYSDFLKQPMKTDFIYQVWNLGSPRLLLWGDPDYVRRFVLSLKLGGGTGFEMNTHLAQKGYGNAPGYWRVFKDPEDEYFTHESERYWFFSLLFGRLSYNPDCSPQVWMRLFRERFGGDAEKVFDIYKAGSEIITFLVQYQLSDYNMYVWPEIDTGGMLDFYMQTPGSDKCVIDIVENYVDGILGDDPSGLFTPVQTAERFREMAEKTLIAAAEIEKLSRQSKELKSTVRDFKIMAYLGLYHSVKTMSAVSLKYYYGTGDITHLRESYKLIRQATVCWEQLISISKDHYRDNMVTGPSDAGSWSTKLPLVYEDEIRVAELIRIAEQYGGHCFAVDFGPVSKEKFPFRSWRDFDILKLYTVERGFVQADGTSRYSKEKGFGWEKGEIKNIAMPYARINDLQFDPYRRDTWDSGPVEKCKGFRSALLEDAVYGSGEAVFRCDLEDGDYEVSVISADQTESARVRGPMSLDIGGGRIGPFIVMPLDECVKTSRVSVSGGALRIGFDSEINADWFVSGIVVKPLKPVINTAPLVSLTRDAASISASIFSPEGINRAALCFEGSGLIPLRLIRGNEYSADLSAHLPFGSKLRLPCVITAESGTGKTATREVVLLLRDKPPHFSVNHTPVVRCEPGTDAAIKASVESAYPLRKARLYYSYVNQFEEMRGIDMRCRGNEYSAVIPGSCIKPEWDLLYYFEFVDETGAGIIYPDFRVRTPYWVINTRPV